MLNLKSVYRFRAPHHYATRRRNSVFITLPLAVRGKVSQMTTDRGTLKLAG